MLSTPKKRILISAALTLAVILLAAAAGFIMKNTSLRLFCAFNALTHLRCPGCGNTRAVLGVLSLDFSAIYRYNLMFAPEMFYVAWVWAFCIKNYVKNGKFAYRSPAASFDISFLIILIIWFVVRNILKI